MINRTARIFWHEYRSHLSRRSYLIFTFGFPLFMLGAPVVGFLILALAVRSVLPPLDLRPVGLIDRAGLTASPAVYPDQPVAILPYSDEAAAASALAEGQIQAYYEVPADYWQTGAASLTYETAPNEAVRLMFRNWLVDQLRTRVTPDLLERLDRGPVIVQQNVAGGQSYAMADTVRAVLVFFLIYFVRMGGSFTAEYMFGSIAGEADNRTLEILLTTVSPLQFVLGKVLGLLAVGLTQLLTWGAAAAALGLVANWLFKVDLLGPLLSWQHLGLMVSVFLAAYVMDQMLAATLGLLRVSGGAGNLLFGVINSVVGLGLLYAAYFVPRSPHTPLAVAASLFPVTAPLVLLIRLVVTEVPAWQIWLSQALLWGTNAASLFWLRRLLQTNLVTYTPPFNLRRWLKDRVRPKGRVIKNV